MAASGSPVEEGRSGEPARPSTPASPGGAWRSGRRRIDAILLLLCALFGGVVSQQLWQRVDRGLFEPSVFDVWFSADLPRTSANMVVPWSNQNRAKVHPIAPLATLQATRVINKLAPEAASVPDAAHRLISAGAGLWTAAVYALCRLLGGSRRAALAFVSLGVASAAFVFWFSVPETYGLGSLTLLAALLVAALPAAARPPWWLYVAASAATLSITITNWMAGLAMAAAKLPWRRALGVTLAALLLVSALALLQRRMLPTAELFFMGSSEELRYVNRPSGGSWWNRLNALLLHPLVMPAIQLVERNPLQWALLSVQRSLPGSHSPLGVAALAGWLVLLGAGAWGAARQWRAGARRPFVITLLCTLAGQVGLHLVYGSESFLYALHLLPVLLALALLALATPLRRAVPMIALFTAISGAINNLGAFEDASSLLMVARHQRDQVAYEKSARASDVWPRGGGTHVVLGEPGGPLGGKAYHELGGNFSPSPGSFGVSVWAARADGTLVASSETVAAPRVRQRFDHGADAVPGLRTDTPYFSLVWRHDGTRSRLSVTPGPASSGLRLWLVLRSVGPAGGPLTRAEGLPHGLRLNGSWRVELPGPARDWRIGDEQVTGVMLQRPAALNRDTSPTGWLYAAVPLDTRTPVEVSIVREAAADRTSPVEAASPAPVHPPLPRPRSPWTPRVPHEAFADSALAQQAHLLMGLTDGQTRAGDPLRHANPWLRDAAYVLVALSRVGQLEIARRLADEVARTDFQGGFGAEADGPGLSLWALGELSLVLNDPSFDAHLWRHVERKAAWLERCLDATGAVVATAAPRSFPDASRAPAPDRLCEAAYRGLIVGRMDEHHPTMFVNASAYAGLVQASKVAERLGHLETASRYRARAGSLRRAWLRELLSPSPPRPLTPSRGIVRAAKDRITGGSPEQQFQRKLAKDWRANRSNERTFVAAQWPTWTLGDAKEAREAFLGMLQARWLASRAPDGGFVHRPPWTYFAFAEAHQWLLLGRPERAWATIDWMFAHSSSPGLYTWWEGVGDKRLGAWWPAVRGAVDPQATTPHYWTAAEALLLQVDMLAYVDESLPGRPVVLGAGVPSAWLSGDLDSGTIHTARGALRWRWSEGRLRVQGLDASVPIVLAGALTGAAVAEGVGVPPPDSER